MPYDAAALRTQLTVPSSLGPVRYVEQTGSTNADLLADVDGPPGEVLVAGHQNAGRGRLDRTWVEPAGTSMMFSVRLRPTAPRATWGWLPLLTGVAIVDALRDTTGLRTSLKWPNDVLISSAEPAAPRKIAGILAEARDAVVVIGCGCNLTQSPGELPVPTATSLAIEGVDVDAVALLGAVLARFGDRWIRFEAAGGDAAASGVRSDYVEHCSTVGRDVVVTRPAGEVRGRATGIGADASLLIVPADGEAGDEIAVMAGDVTHVRPRG